MGTYTKIECDDARLLLPKEAFCSPRTVQGGTMAQANGVKRVESPKRFKLFSEGVLLLHIAEGNGFIKWKRGEIPFCADETLRFERAGEIELNGKCTFLYLNENLE